MSKTIVLALLLNQKVVPALMKFNLMRTINGVKGSICYNVSTFYGLYFFKLDRKLHSISVHMRKLEKGLISSRCGNSK